MIQTELQLGNYVYIINRNHEVHIPIEIPQRISKVGLFEVEVGGLKISDKEPITVSTVDISPIPLTKDILIRCGFEKKVFYTPMGDIEVVSYKAYGVLVYLIKDGFEVEKIIRDGGSVNLFTTFKYLHQLQNLVKLLCNQTIELK